MGAFLWLRGFGQLHLVYITLYRQADRLHFWILFAFFLALALAGLILVL